MTQDPSPETVLVVCHEGYDDLGALEAPIRALGLRRRLAYREHLDERQSLQDVGLVMSMGSLSDPVTAQGRVAASGERGLLRRALHARRPVIGVCFGAQLLAADAGAALRRLDTPATGWQDVGLRHDRGPERARLFQWNQFAFEAPPGARALADQDGVCLAFERGSALGLQFHLDVTPGLLARWIADAEHDDASLDGLALRRGWIDAEQTALRGSAEMARRMVLGHVGAHGTSRMRRLALQSLSGIPPRRCRSLPPNYPR